MGVLGLQNDRPSIHASAFVAPGASLIGRVEIGRDSSIWYNVVARADINFIRIGERTNIQDTTVLHVTHELPVIIGDDVTVGHRALIHGCTVGNGSLIGMGAILLDAVQVGAQALVAAGAVVREGFTVPEGTLVAGIPARIVRDLTPEERARLMTSAQNYVEYARHHQSCIHDT
jgi:carbonic anhydrase/acetyltransferase-like protein (isoleucine patch superfamily)